LWKGIEEEVVPALWGEEHGGRVAVGRGRLVQYGRVLVAERRVWSEHDWAAGLELHVEVFDRMDGLQMLSARGPLEYQFTEEMGILLHLPARPIVEVRGSSFSAASRDPEQRRFADIESYFSEGHRAEYPCSLCVRVTVRDVRTGKRGLLWEEGKGTARRPYNPAIHWAARLPEGTKSVVSSVKRMLGVELAGGWLCSTSFCVCPDPEQEGVAEVDRLYHVATSADDSERADSGCRIAVGCFDIAAVHLMIRAVLER
jgi:hypothetical protein